MTDKFITFQMLVIDPMKTMLATIAGYIPTLVGAFLILFIGWGVAKVIRSAFHQVFKAIYIDKIADKAGLSDALDKGGIRMTVSELLSTLVYWLVIVMVLVMTINALGLTVASQLLDRLFAYIPNVISAVFVLVLGMFLGNFVSGIVHAAAKNTNIPKPEILGKVSKYAIVVFAVTISLEQLGIAPLLIGATFNIILGGIVFGLALAFGLGGKDAAARYLEDLRRKK